MQYTRVAKSGVLKIVILSSRPDDCNRYLAYMIRLSFYLFVALLGGCRKSALTQPAHSKNSELHEDALEPKRQKADSLVLITNASDISKHIGNTVTIRGKLLHEKYSTVLGLYVEGDWSHYSGKLVELKGELFCGDIFEMNEGEIFETRASFNSWNDEPRKVVGKCHGIFVSGRPFVSPTPTLLPD